MSRFEIALNIIFGAIFILIASANPLHYIIGFGFGQLLICIFEMVMNDE